MRASASIVHWLVACLGVGRSAVDPGQMWHELAMRSELLSTRE